MRQDPIDLFAIARAIEDLKAKSADGPSAMEDAIAIYMALRGWSSRYLAWDADEERAKLKEMERAAMALARAYESLNPLLHALLTNTELKDREPQPRIGDVAPPEPVFALDYLPWLARTIARARRNMEPFVKAGFDPGAQKKWQWFPVIEECRAIYERRTGRRAPRKSLNEATPFGRFLADVLAECGATGNARYLYAEWGNVQVSGEETSET